MTQLSKAQNAQQDYIQWGESTFQVFEKIVMNDASMWHYFCVCENITLYIDTEGCPYIQMVQISTDHDENIYVFNKERFLRQYNKILFNSKSKKIFWDISGEISRLKQIFPLPSSSDSTETDLKAARKCLRAKVCTELNCEDLQEKFSKMSLKHAIGFKYGVELQVNNRETFYKNKFWKYPDQQHLIYAALDVQVMKELVD